MKKVSTFFKILNKKIEEYEKKVSNSFALPRPVVITWVEDNVDTKEKE